MRPLLASPPYPKRHSLELAALKECFLLLGRARGIEKQKGRIHWLHIIFIFSHLQSKNVELHAKVPHGHWKTLTFVAALRCEGIDAPCVFDGPINGESFKAYVEQVLAPALRPGDVVVMDNSP